MKRSTEMTDSAAREERSGRLPSLAAQTPGLDTFQESRCSGYFPYPAPIVRLW
jgi:hypothetical protein